MPILPMVRVNQSLVLLVMAGAIAVGLQDAAMGLLQGPGTEAPSAVRPAEAPVITDNEVAASSQSSVTGLPVERDAPRGSAPTKSDGY